MNSKSSLIPRKISAPTISRNAQINSNPSTISPMCSPGRSEKNPSKNVNKTPEKATNRTHENPIKNQNTSKSPQRSTLNSNIQKPISHSSKFLAQQKNHQRPTNNPHSQTAPKDTPSPAKENNLKMAHSPASKASSQNPTAMPSPAISHIPFEEQSLANQTFPSSFFINENQPQPQSSASPSYLNFFESAPKTSTKNTLSIFFPHEDNNLKITKRPENLLSEKKIEEKISETQTSANRTSASPKEKERKMNLLKDISHGSVSRPKERLASSIDRHDFYSDDFSLKSLTSKSNAERPRTNSVKSSQNNCQTPETASKQSLSQQERSETFSPERFIKKSKERSQDRLQATSSSPSRESPRFGSHYKINTFTSESTRPAKVKEILTNFPDYDQNAVRNININPKNIKEVPKMSSQESSSGFEQKESSSNLKSFLVEPRSTNYGKFSKIYKGIENKDSWRFNFQRFQKLERKSPPSKASKFFQSPERPTASAGKGVLHLEQSRTKVSTSPYGLDEIGLSISKESIQEPRERNSSHSSTKVSTKSQPTTYRNFFSSAANSTNTSLTTVDKKAYASHVTTPKKQKEENACGDTLNYLLSLKEKGLLGKKIGENDLEIEQILNGLKKEVGDLNGVNDIQKRTELEEKLMLLLEMTVQGMASLVAKKNKTFQKYQQKGNSVNV